MGCKHCSFALHYQGSVLRSELGLNPERWSRSAGWYFRCNAPSSVLWRFTSELCVFVCVCGECCSQAETRGGGVVGVTGMSHVPFPARTDRLHIHSQTMNFGGCAPGLMWEVVTQGQGVPDHQALRISGVLHIRTFCLWCCLTKLVLACVVFPVSMLSLLLLTLSAWRPLKRQSPEEDTGPGVSLWLFASSLSCPLMAPGGGRF